MPDFTTLTFWIPIITALIAIGIAIPLLINFTMPDLAGFRVMRIMTSVTIVVISLIYFFASNCRTVMSIMMLGLSVAQLSYSLICAKNTGIGLSTISIREWSFILLTLVSGVLMLIFR